MALAPLRIAIEALRDNLAAKPRDWTPGSFSARHFDLVQSTGLSVVENFADADTCRRLHAEIIRVQDHYPGAVSRRSNGADLRTFGEDKASEAIGQFGSDPQLHKLAVACLGQNAVNAFTLAATIRYTPGNQGSGEGWHRDAFVGQFKAILYLTDVSEDTGPFEYILNSHRLLSKYQDKRRHDVPLHTTRIKDEIVEEIIRHESERHKVVTGPAGSLVLADTTGIHRGRPLRSGSRAALTNYYFKADQVTPSFVDHFRPVLGIHIAA
jgi:hypothetical protein